MMEEDTKIIKISHEAYSLFLKKLADVFHNIDKKYDEAAEYYGFKCQGCEDNCCKTRFYHYTHLEFFYVRKGLGSLSPEKQLFIEKAACDVVKTMNSGNGDLRLMCPLNTDGKCVIYQFRPMICRLHGLPHEFNRPDGAVIQGKGCDAFYNECNEKDYFKLDRTPFYFKMANLEKELREKLRLTQKIKMTVAEMIVEKRLSLG